MEVDDVQASEARPRSVRDAEDLLRSAEPYGAGTVRRDDFLQKLEVIIEEGCLPDESDAEPTDVFEWLHRQWEQVGPVWRRVLFAGQVAIDNACDPNADTLEWKPEIAAALAAVGNCGKDE